MTVEKLRSRACGRAIGHEPVVSDFLFDWRQAGIFLDEEVSAIAIFPQFLQRKRRTESDGVLYPASPG